MVLDATLLNTQHYKIRIKVKWSNPGKGVVPSPMPTFFTYLYLEVMILDLTREPFLNVIFTHFSTPNCIPMSSLILFTVDLLNHHFLHITSNHSGRIGGLIFS